MYNGKSVIILLVGSFILIAGCTGVQVTTPTSSPTPTPIPFDPLVGTWTCNAGGSSLTYTFNADGTWVMIGVINGIEMTTPTQRWNRLDETHYNVISTDTTSVLIFDANKTYFYFVSSPTLTFTATVTPRPTQMQKTLTNGILSVATRTDIPPLVSMNSLSGKPEGLDIDLIYEIAKELNMEVLFTNLSSENIIPSIANNQYDCAICGIIIKPERKQYVSFSNPYITDSSGQCLGIAININNAGLKADINNALAKIVADGRFQAICNKWLS